jgi:molybdopterin-guanine dinucleotide biosynthesis protein A
MGGGDKALVRLGGLTLLDRVIARLAPQVSALALNANGDAARFAGVGLPVLADTVPDNPGPLAGILAALDWAAGQGADHVVTVPVDTPFLPHDLGARLVAVSDGAAPVLAATSGAGQATRAMVGGVVRHPACGLWPVALRDDLRAALGAGTRKVAAWADGHGARTAVFDDAAFFNVNTPGDLRVATGRL